MAHSKACCTIPPIIASKEYATKGVYETIDGTKTYITGPSDATTGILLIMDIFGFFPQTLQGADILGLSGPQRYRVFMPDFFDGEPAPIEWYPPTDATRDKLGDWFNRKGNFMIGKDKTLQYLESFKQHNPQITTWIAVGYCWGGKVVTLTSGASTPWAASVQCHPAFVSADDAKAISIPHVLLASKDEDAAEVKSFEENLKGEKLVETFGTQIHGWMAARADLEDPDVLKEYERGYRVVLDFLGRNLSPSSTPSKI